MTSLDRFRQEIAAKIALAKSLGSAQEHAPPPISFGASKSIG
jgi:hypothetical protein